MNSPLHSITSSARASSVGGDSRPGSLGGAKFDHELEISPSQAGAPARLIIYAGSSPALVSEVRLPRCFVFMRCHLVGIDAHHQIGDVIVDLREPVPCAGRNNDHVSGLELIAHTIANRGTVV